MSSDQSNFAWLPFALLTVVMWGAYGVCLHTGQTEMQDPANGRWKAFLWVGVAYFLVGVLVPVGILLANGAKWGMSARAITWSLGAGMAGALGALGVLLALAKGKPPEVMSIVFAGAPIVNALLSMALHPPDKGVKWQFVLGILLACAGGYLVALYKPPPPKAPVPAEAQP